MMTLLKKSLWLGLLGCVLSSGAWAEAGRVIFTSGDVIVRDAKGVEKPAVTGMLLDQGDTVLTRTGMAQVHFLDGGQVSLVRNTVFRIDQFRYVGKVDGEKSFFSLVRGGLRAISGVIGHRNPGSYKMETPVATIGIRGTEYQLILCESNCKEPDGLYIHTGEGKISVKNAFGEIDLAKGQSGYVASATTPPRETTTTPGVTAAPTGASAPPVVTKQGEFQPGAIVSSNGLGTVTPLTNAGLGLAGSGTITGFGVTGTMDGAGAGAANFNNVLSTTFPVGNGVGAYFSGNQVTGWVVWSNGQYASLMLGTPQNAGSLGNLYWGRWTNTSITAFAALSQISGSSSISLPASSSIHYILGTSVPTIPGAGTATYSFAGGTPSTDPSGFVGSGVTSGTLTAYFNYNEVQANFNVNHGASYNVNAYTFMNSNNRASFSSNNGGSVNINGNFTPSSKVEGFFAGTNSPTAPSTAGLTYNLKPGGALGTSGIVGVAAFQCSRGC